MKYIRTKDGHIYDVRHLNIDGPLKDGLSTELFVAHSGKSQGPSMVGCIPLNHMCNVNDIVKESNKVEDLFDEKVLAIDGQKPVIANISNLDEFKGSSFSNAKYYGAVWTSSGLTYFAEFKEGEWELLTEEELKTIIKWLEGEE